MPLRFDRGSARKATRTATGALRVPAAFAKTGVLEYQQPDGTIVRELVLDADLFHADSLATYEDAVVTHRHPATGLVTAENIDKVTRGYTKHARKADDGQHVEGELLITHPATIAAVEAGEREISCGYHVDHEPVPGGVHKFPDGTEVRADVYQKNRRVNHIAIEPQGRAGPTVAIRLDSAGNAIFSDERIDQMDPKEAEALKKKNEELERKLAEEAKLRTDEKAAADKKDGELQAAKQQLAKVDQEKADKAHADLCARVEPIIGKTVNVAGEEVAIKTLKAPDLRKRTLAKLAPDLKLDAMSEAAVEGAFEFALSKHVKTDEADGDGGTGQQAGDLALDSARASGGDALSERRKKAKANYADTIFNAHKYKATDKATK